jgi:hypothetical protein
LIDVLLGLLLPFITILSIVIAVRHGPFKNRWWRVETWAGFTLTVAWICFLIGFVGPMIFAPGANQGPLLGVLYTGPIGLIIGFVWGGIRAKARSG